MNRIGSIHRKSARLLLCLVVAGSGMASARPADAQGIGMEQLKHMMAWGTGSLILVDQFEYAPSSAGRPVSLDGVAWWGGAYNRLWLKAEGEQITTGKDGEVEGHLYYGRLISAYFDALAGVRIDASWGAKGAARAHLALGLEGLAPMRFEFSPALFVSNKGDVSARLEAEYQLLITQRLVASPEVELNAAVREVPEWGIGSGLNDIELGLRVRYEFRPEFAPYVGYAWRRRVGATAQLARDDGDPVSEGAFVAGLRVWR